MHIAGTQALCRSVLAFSADVRIRAAKTKFSRAGLIMKDVFAAQLLRHFHCLFWMSACASWFKTQFRKEKSAEGFES